MKNKCPDLLSGVGFHAFVSFGDGAEAPLTVFCMWALGFILALFSLGERSTIISGRLCFEVTSTQVAIYVVKIRSVFHVPGP